LAGGAIVRFSVMSTGSTTVQCGWGGVLVWLVQQCSGKRSMNNGTSVSSD